MCFLLSRCCQTSERSWRLDQDFIAYYCDFINITLKSNFGVLMFIKFHELSKINYNIHMKKKLF